MNQQTASPKHGWLRRIGRTLAWLFLVLIALAVARGYFAFRDRHPGYSLKLDIDTQPPDSNGHALRAGFGRVKINPDISNPRDPVWVAGFSQHRAATAIHDDLWATACVIDNGAVRLGIVALDAIGFFNDDVIEVRRRLASDLNIDYAIVCSTHNHSTPDLMGLWGPNFFRTGVNAKYREQVIEASVSALKQAVGALQPAAVAFHELRTDPAGLVADTRKPEVFDPDIRVMHFVKAGTDETIGSLVGWGDHPETPWGKNTEITSDFCGYLREALEKGVSLDGKKAMAGLGGIHVYVNGAIGGLMSTTPAVTVHDPFLNEDFQKPSHEKARALGRQLAFRIYTGLAETNHVFFDRLPISIHARTIDVPLKNNLYLLAGYFGIVDRGYVRWRTLRTEVALVTLGEASISCIPGEIYPEIVNGGIEHPAGADFDIQPVEVPPLRSLMPGKVRFVFGLANDEIGYLVPKSQWDEKTPYTYGRKSAPYGEVNSVGPDAAAAVHAAVRSLCRK